MPGCVFSSLDLLYFKSDFFVQLEERLHLVLHLFADCVAEYAEGCTKMDSLLVLAQLLVPHLADTLQTVFYSG